MLYLLIDATRERAVCGSSAGPTLILTVSRQGKLKAKEILLLAQIKYQNERALASADKLVYEPLPRELNVNKLSFCINLSSPVKPVSHAPYTQTDDD